MEGDGGLLESSEPGYLKVQMDHEVFYPYREDHGYKVCPRWLTTLCRQTQEGKVDRGRGKG